MTCSNPKDTLHLPIMNTNPATFRLRTEIRWFLKDNYSNVIFLNDIDLNDLNQQNKLEIILVDHHCLRCELNRAVIEIIDHHQVQNDSIVLQDSNVITIEPVGSCCTLIAEKLLSSSFAMTEEIADLLTGPILFDTINFSPDAGKVTGKDQLIYEQLRSFRSPCANDSDLYTNLRESASDVSGLTIEDLLQKDVKLVVSPKFSLVMSSLPMNFTVESLINKFRKVTELDEFLLKNKNADGLIIMSIEADDTYTKRQLGFYAKNLEHVQRLYECIRNNELQLDLQERVLPIDEPHIKLFDQMNVKASRKQILPFLERLIQDFT